MILNFDQKSEALASLAPLEIRYREEENRIGHSAPWYVNHDVEVKNGSMLTGTYGNGSSPAEAIEDHWHVLTDLKAGEYLVINAYGDRRRAVRWNGYMWADVDEQPKTTEHHPV